MKRRVVAICFFWLLSVPWARCAEKGAELIQNKEGQVLQPQVVEATAARMRHLKVPEGFHIELFATGLGAPRMLAVGQNGTVYVTRRESGDVLALEDKNGDGKAEIKQRVVQALPGVL